MMDRVMSIQPHRNALVSQEGHCRIPLVCFPVSYDLYWLITLMGDELFFPFCSIQHEGQSKMIKKLLIALLSAVFALSAVASTGGHQTPTDKVAARHKQKYHQHHKAAAKHKHKSHQHYKAAKGHHGKTAMPRPVGPNK